MEGLSPLHLIVILVVALIVLGPGKLPETGAAIGRAVREFRHGMTDDVRAVTATSPGDPAGDDAIPASPPTQAP
jgi:sec-independent protein translocase protein TatA